MLDIVKQLGPVVLIFGDGISNFCPYLWHFMEREREEGGNCVGGRLEEMKRGKQWTSNQINYFSIHFLYNFQHCSHYLFFFFSFYDFQWGREFGWLWSQRKGVSRSLAQYPSFFCFYRVLVRLERDLFRAFEFDTHPIKMSPLQMPLRFLKFCIIQFILLFVWS